MIVAEQLDIFEEQRKARYQAYWNWFYRGSLERAKKRREEFESSKAIPMQTISIRSAVEMSKKWK